MVLTSARSGTSSSVTGASVRSAAASAGRAAFFAPLARTVPRSLTGPLRRKASIRGASVAARGWRHRRPESCQRRTAVAVRGIPAASRRMATSRNGARGLDERRDVARLPVPELEHERGSLMEEGGEPREEDAHRLEAVAPAVKRERRLELRDRFREVGRVGHGNVGRVRDREIEEGPARERGEPVGRDGRHASTDAVAARVGGGEGEGRRRAVDRDDARARALERQRHGQDAAARAEVGEGAGRRERRRAPLPRCPPSRRAGSARASRRGTSGPGIPIRRGGIAAARPRRGARRAPRRPPGSPAPPVRSDGRETRRGGVPRPGRAALPPRTERDPRPRGGAAPRRAGRPRSCRVGGGAHAGLVFKIGEDVRPPDSRPFRPSASRGGRRHRPAVVARARGRRDRGGRRSRPVRRGPVLAQSGFALRPGDVRARGLRSGRRCDGRGRRLHAGSFGPDRLREPGSAARAGRGRARRGREIRVGAPRRRLRDSRDGRGPERSLRDRPAPGGAADHAARGRHDARRVDRLDDAGRAVRQGRRSRRLAGRYARSRRRRRAPRAPPRLLAGGSSRRGRVGPDRGREPPARGMGRAPSRTLSRGSTSSGPRCCPRRFAGTYGRKP